MISTSTPFATANAELAKKPLFRLEIEGYSRVFTNFSSDFGNVVLQSANHLADYGGAEAFTSVVTLPSGDTVAFNGGNPGFIGWGNFELFSIEVCAAPLSYTIANGSGSPASITSGSVSVSFGVDVSSTWSL